MKQKLFFTAIILFVYFTSANAQMAGYFGKKNFLNINVGGHVGFSRVIFDTGDLNFYDESTNRVERSDSWVTKRSHWSLGYTRLIKENMMIGIDYRRTSFFVPSGYYNYTISFDSFYSMDFHATSPRATAQTIKLVYVFSQENSLLPMGINHAISIGPRFVNIHLDRDYYFEYKPDWSSPAEVGVIAPPPTGFKNSMSGFEISYTNTLKYPISRFLIFNFGVEFRLAITRDNSDQRFEMRNKFNSYTDGGVSKEYYNHNYSTEVRRSELFNWFNVFAGFTVPF